MTVRTGAASTCLLIAVVLVLGGCGEKVDELGPYVDKLREVDPYNAKLVEYRRLLKAGRQDEATGVAETMQAYLAKLETFGLTDDKTIKAGHNALKRDLKHGLKKIVQPDFPTYTVSALRQIDIIEEGYKQHVNNLKRRWQEEQHPGEFSLAWPEATSD